MLQWKCLHLLTTYYFRGYQKAGGAVFLKTIEQCQLFHFVKTDIDTAREMKVMQNGKLFKILFYLRTYKAKQI